MKAFVGMLEIYCTKIQYSNENHTSQVARPTMATRGFTSQCISSINEERR